MDHVSGHRWTAWIAITTALCGVAVSACGSSGAPSTSKLASRSSPFLRYSQCMRANGVPNFPDPSGGGIHIGPGSGIDPASPAFRAAQTKCQKLLPGGGPANMHPTQQMIAQTLQISECMRAHGVTGFPDPTTGPPPTPGTRGIYSLVEDRGGVVLALPATINPASPSFQHAAKVCGFS